MTHGSRIFRCALLAAAAAALALAPADGYAQQAGHNIPGDMGMMSGTQAPPGIYAGSPTTPTRPTSSRTTRATR
jgi:hypothetical protein